MTVPAYNDSLELDDTAPRLFASDGEITHPVLVPAPLPQPLAVRRPTTWLSRARQFVADWVSPRSWAELRAERQLIDADIVNHAAERHWQLHPVDRAALRHWGVAQDEQAAAVERLLAARAFGSEWSDTGVTR